MQLSSEPFSARSHRTSCPSQGTLPSNWNAAPSVLAPWVCRRSLLDVSWLVLEASTGTVPLQAIKLVYVFPDNCLAVELHGVVMWTLLVCDTVVEA